MPEFSFRLTSANSLMRGFLTAFLLTLLTGYLTGVYFVDFTTESHPEGILAQFRGNEDAPLETVQEIKYPKSTREMLTIIHAHITSFALIFFGAGSIFLLTQVRKSIKYFLVTEPFVATLVLFASMAGVRYLPETWAYPLTWLMMLAGLSTFVALFAMVGIALYELWTGQPIKWLQER